jgi:hypothetical protein
MFHRCNSARVLARVSDRRRCRAIALLCICALRSGGLAAVGTSAAADTDTTLPDRQVDR